jgi:hypothetical protein
MSDGKFGRKKGRTEEGWSNIGTSGLKNFSIWRRV